MNSFLALSFRFAAHNGNAARSRAHRDGNGDLEELHDNAQHSQGNLGIFRLSEHRIQGGIFGAHVLYSGHGDHQRNLGQETGHAQGQELLHEAAPNAEALAVQLHRFHMAQVPQRQRCRQNLAQHRRNGGALHPHLQRENKNRVQNNIGHRTQNRGAHGKPRAAVRANDGIHGLAEHIEGDAQRNPEKVFFGAGVSALIDLAAEHGQNRLHKDQVQRRQHQAAGDAQNNGISDAPVGVLLFIGAQADADKGAAAVADHHGNGQSHHGQRKYHRVGRIAIGTQIRCIGNKNLVHDVIQRGDQQGNHAGHRVFPHQCSETFPFEKVICLRFHWIVSSCFLQMRKKTTQGVFYTLCRIRLQKALLVSFQWLFSCLYFTTGRAELQVKTPGRFQPDRAWTQALSTCPAMGAQVALPEPPCSTMTINARG